MMFMPRNTTSRAQLFFETSRLNIHSLRVALKLPKQPDDIASANAVKARAMLRRAGENFIGSPVGVTWSDGAQYRSTSRLPPCEILYEVICADSRSRACSRSGR